MKDFIIKNKGTIYFLLILILFTFGVLFIDRKNLKSNNYSLKDITKYEVNSVVPVYVSKEEMANKYLIDFLYIASTSPIEAYKLLDDDFKNEKFLTYEDYEKYIKSLVKESKKALEYAVSTKNNKRVYYVKDNVGNEYEFIENSIMDYKVAIN